MKPPTGDVSAASRDAILDQLGTILASAVFQGAERSTKLLRYLVEHAANGHTNGLKEYTLGAEALGKGSSFDPRTDTIVRAEASRLRNRLERYYAAEGRADPIVITLPKGSYVPQFKAQSASPDEAIPAGPRPRSLSERFTWFALGIGVAACLFVLIAWSARRAPEPVAAVSIAVLPFANMSGDASQDFFSDGMAEEINTALARIPDLRVVARTSAFQFRNHDRDVPAIASALNATHLVDGTVRRMGTRVRITAQLVKADGVNVWTASYDRELTDVFAIQEGIAEAIAGELRIPLGLKPGERLVSERPADQETYDLYLRGRLALRTRSRQEVELFEQVVARDPNFAPGWAMLAEARREMAVHFERRGEDSKRAPLLEGAETAARKAIALAPDYAGGYSALASVAGGRGKWVEAMELFRQGLARNPEAPELLHNYRGTLRALGYLQEALKVSERMYLLEPLVPLYNRQRALTLLANGESDAGLGALLRLNGSSTTLYFLAPAYSEQGRFAEAVHALRYRDLPSADPIRGVYAEPLVAAAAEVIRAKASKADPPTQLPDFYSELNFVYAYTSTPERVLDWPEKSAKEGDYRPLQSVWWPTPQSVRKTQRFKTLMRNAGVVDYWRTHTWPDLCRPMGADDFVCD